MLWMIAILFHFQQYGQQAMTSLDQYLLIAAENNPQLKAHFNEYMAALERVPQAGALPDPQFAFGYFINPVETRVGPQRASLGLSQAFPWFGTLGAKKDAMSEMARSRFELFQNARSDLFFDVKTAYYNYYFIEKAIEITRENIEILNIFRNLSLVKIEAGTASLADELRVELELNDLENQLALFIDSRDVFRTSFNNLLNRDNSVMIEVPQELYEEELPFESLSLLDSILTSNREIRSLDHKLQSFREQEEVAQKSGMPGFNIGMNYIVIGENRASLDPDNGKDAFFPTIGVSIPIYRKKYKSMIREAEYMQEAVVSEKEDKRNSLSTLFQENMKDFRDSDRRLSLNHQQSEIANKVLDILITSYSTNSKDFEEVLRIERQLLGYKLARERALIDKNVSVAFMNYLLGN
jgi:outer membrane protein TolC